MGETRIPRSGEGRVQSVSRGIAALAASLGLLVLPALLLANGGTLRVADAPVGAYRVSVYTDPTPPRPDSVDVSILVVRENDPTPVPDLEIVVRAAPLEADPGAAMPEAAPEPVPPPGVSDGGAPGLGVAARTLRATRDQADDPRYYAAKFAPGRTGPWRFEVDVRGSEGEGTLSFEVRVRELGLLDRPWLVVGLALLPLALLTAWLLRSGPEPPDGPPSAGRPHRSAAG